MQMFSVMPEAPAPVNGAELVSATNDWKITLSMLAGIKNKL